MKLSIKQNESLEDRIMKRRKTSAVSGWDWVKEFSAELAAELVARFIVGAGAAIFFLFAIGGRRLGWDLGLKQSLLLAGCVGVGAALFGLRKGPGLI